ASFADEFGKTGLIKQRDLLARGLVFGAVASEPVLPPERILRRRLYALTRKPIRTFPARFHAEARSVDRQPRVQRSRTQAASSLKLAIGPRRLVMQAQHLRHPLTQERAVIGPGSEAANIDRPQVQSGLPFDHPFGEIFS